MRVIQRLCEQSGKRAFLPYSSVREVVNVARDWSRRRSRLVLWPQNLSHIPSDRSSPSNMTLNIHEIAGLLEIVASERPALLGPLVETLRDGPTFQEVLGLARSWYVEPADLALVAARATRQLGRLEKRQRHWRHPSQIVGSPNVPALWSFALARRDRVPGVARARRLNMLANRLRRIAEIEDYRRQLETFLREPVKPMDRAWLENFLGCPRIQEA